MTHDRVPATDLLARYEQHVQLRDLEPETVSHYRRCLSRFLDYLDADPDLELRALTPVGVRDFIIVYGQEHGVDCRRLMHTTLRGFLAFAYQHGLMERDLSAAVPGVRLYRLSGAPRPIREESVEAILASVDRNTEAGCRDFAMLKLLHIYGPRAVQLQRLALDDIDWDNDTITFPAAKNGVRVLAPLLPEAGNAVLDYIRRFREPHPEVRELFLTATPPPRPLATATIRWAVRWRITAAEVDLGRGVKSGSHAFRYACATRMLKAQCSLKTVADALGHRKFDSVQVYNKLDVEALRELALPWPEDLS